MHSHLSQEVQNGKMPSGHHELHAHLVCPKILLEKDKQASSSTE